jgi:DNA polymerase-1
MLCQMMRTGIEFDPFAADRLADRVRGLMLEHETAFYSAVGRNDFAIGSPDQVERVLFGKRSRGGLDLDPGNIRLTKSQSRYKVDDDALAFLEAQHTCIPHLRDWRGCSKLLTTYAVPLAARARLDPARRIYTTFNNCQVLTGRLSSSDPNLQNIPSRSELGRAVRGCFVPSFGNALGAIDLAQIEIVLAAHYSKSIRLLEALNKKADIHSISAAKFFNWPGEYGNPVNVDKKKLKSWLTENLDRKDQRSNAKIGNFGSIYEITPGGLSVRMVGLGADPDVWTDQHCADFLDTFYAPDMYYEIGDYQNEQHRRARLYGLVYTLFGRIRYIPEVKSAVPKIAEEGNRFASNTPIQGTAGDLLKLIMIILWERVCKIQSQFPHDPYVLVPLIQIHDELVFEGRPSILAEFLQWAAEEVIPNCCRLLAPISAGYGMTEENWEMLER